MNCRDCSYAEEICSYDETDWNLWCDKVGGTILYSGQCEDAVNCGENISLKKENKRYRGEKRHTKRERDVLHKNRLKFLAENLHSYYPSPAYCKTEKFVGWDNGGYVPIEKPYYKRCYMGNHKGNRYEFYKKCANRCVRRYKGEIGKGKNYRKVFDLWWEVD